MTSQVASPIYTVSILANPQSTTIGTTVLFTVTVNTTSAYRNAVINSKKDVQNQIGFLEYSFDYGDGSPQTNYYQNINATTTRNYFAPGTYLVTVFVQNAAGKVR